MEIRQSPESHVANIRFNQLPCRPDGYLPERNVVDTFPLSFCKTKWVENGNIALKEKLNCEVNSLSKSKRLVNNKSYDWLVESHSDTLVVAKQHLIKCIKSKFGCF